MRKKILLFLSVLMICSLIGCGNKDNKKENIEKPNQHTMETGGIEKLQIDEKVQEYADFIKTNNGVENQDLIIQKGLDLFKEGTFGSKKITSVPEKPYEFRVLSFKLEDGQYISVSEYPMKKLDKKDDKFYLYLFSKEKNDNINKADKKFAITTGDPKNAMLSKNYNEARAILGAPSMLSIELIENDIEYRWLIKNSDHRIDITVNENGNFYNCIYWDGKTVNSPKEFYDFSIFEKDFNLSYDEFLEKHFDQISTVRTHENQKIFGANGQAPIKKEGVITVGIKNNESEIALLEKYGIKTKRKEFRVAFYYADNKFHRAVLLDI